MTTPVPTRRSKLKIRIPQLLDATAEGHLAVILLSVIVVALFLVLARTPLFVG